MSLLDLFHPASVFRRRRLELVTPLWAGEHASTRRAYAHAVGARDKANRLADLTYQLRFVEQWYAHTPTADVVHECLLALEQERRKLARSVREAREAA